MRNTTDYEYIVFYYDMDELAKSTILKDLYAHKLKVETGKDTTEDALSVQETDFIEDNLSAGADDMAVVLQAWTREFIQEGSHPNIYGIPAYEYGKLNIDPGNDSPGNYMVFRVYIPEFSGGAQKKQPAMYKVADTHIEKYIVHKVLREWALLNGQIDVMRRADIIIEEAESKVVAALTSRHSPAVINYTFY